MTQLFELTSGGTNNFSVYVYANDEEVLAGVFKTDGKPKNWEKRPSVQAFVDKKKKVQKPQADIGWLTPGTIILNEKAFAALKDFLLQFGELAELNCNGDTRYFYNITNLISCIDVEKSEKSGGGSILKAEFLPEMIPANAQIFKDPRTVSSRIYLTPAAKSTLEKIIQDEGLTGLLFFEAGKKF